ncbi:MAG: hypothetical protein M3Z18_03035 [Gemmatimonadota bacterium]|nr:hypothetical protein [Gemmatimonadota bacterium]
MTTFRLYLMRALYLLIFVFLSTSIWPILLNHKPWADMMHGVADSLLAALALLMAMGLRYPLKLLPALLFEWLWKTIWVVAIGIPLWRSGQLDADTAETLRDCSVGVILVPLVIPWPYFFRHYMKAPGDRWGRATNETQAIAR